MTKKGRCFPFWEEFMRCHETTHYPVHQCRNQMEDYVECLHQRKEVLTGGGGSVGSG